MKDNSKTLVIFSPAFPANEQDNWLPWLQNIILAMNNDFPELKIIVFSFKYPNHTHSYKWKGNEIFSFGSKRKNKMATLLSRARIFFAFKKINKANKIAGVLSIWCGECAYLAKICTRSTGIKHFTWIVGQDARAGNEYVKKIQPDGRQLVAMSDFLQAEFYRNYKIKPAHIIPTGINTSLYKTELIEKTIDILGVGSLSPLKQYDVFIDVIDAIKKRMPNIRTEICGGGEEKDSLQKKIDSHSLQENILLHGELPHAEVTIKMQQSKILLHTSMYEGFGNIYLEALYGGAHVIGFTKAMNEAIKNWHVVRSKEEMIEKAISLLTDNNTRYERVLYHTYNETAAKLVSLFV